jgi:uncharacterized membrane protein
MNTTLLLGLFIFFATHSVRIIADDWRSAAIVRLGPLPWKSLIVILSLISFGLMVWGYGTARSAPVELWSPPRLAGYLAALLTLPAFILLVAAYVPGNRLKAAVGHPMVAGVKLWALSHLLANGNLADVLLFGSFLVWAGLSFSAARRRDRRAGTCYPVGTLLQTLLTIFIGGLAWIIFAVSLHEILIGVRPFG